VAAESSEALRRAFAVGLLLALLGLFSYMISGFFGALVFAGASALMFYPLQQRLERHLHPNAAAAINLLLLVVVVIVPAIVLLGLAAGQALAFVDQASSWIGDRLNSDAPLAGLDFPTWFPFEAELESLRDEFTSKLGQIAGTVGRFVVSTLSYVTQATALFLLDVFVAAYFFFYCLLSGDELADNVLASLPMHEEDRQEFLDVGANVTRSILKSLVIIGAVQGFFSGLAFYLVGIKGVIFWGIVMGFLSVIPFIGPIIIWLPVAVYLALQGHYWEAAFLAGWFWIFVASIDNVLRPYLVGSDTKMPDVLVLLTTLGGLFTFGAIGLLIGPLIGALLMAAWAVYRKVFRSELVGSDLVSSDLGGQASPMEPAVDDQTT
jgi:predicted PurR-regulated permease PerM